MRSHRRQWARSCALERRPVPHDRTRKRRRDRNCDNNTYTDDAFRCDATTSCAHGLWLALLEQPRGHPREPSNRHWDRILTEEQHQPGNQASDRRAHNQLGIRVSNDNPCVITLDDDDLTASCGAWDCRTGGVGRDPSVAPCRRRSVYRLRTCARLNVRRGPRPHGASIPKSRVARRVQLDRARQPSNALLESRLREQVYVRQRRREKRWSHVLKTYRNDPLSPLPELLHPCRSSLNVDPATLGGRVRQAEHDEVGI